MFQHWLIKYLESSTLFKKAELPVFPDISWSFWTLLPPFKSKLKMNKASSFTSAYFISVFHFFSDIWEDISLYFGSVLCCSDPISYLRINPISVCVYPVCQRNVFRLSLWNNKVPLRQQNRESTVCWHGGGGGGGWLWINSFCYATWCHPLKALFWPVTHSCQIILGFNFCSSPPDHHISLPVCHH